MYDKKAARRRYLAQLEIRKELARYQSECKELRTYQMTEEEFAKAQEERKARQEEIKQHKENDRKRGFTKYEDSYCQDNNN